MKNQKVQTAIRIDRELLDALRRAAADADRSVSAEMHRRLWESFISPEAVRYEQAWLSQTNGKTS